MNQWAFYPGFPFLTRGVMQVTDTGFATAASLVDLVCGLVAAIAMAGCSRRGSRDTAALAVVAVWAALPVAPSLQLAYSEALALALLSAHPAVAAAASTGDAPPWQPCSSG